MRKRGGSHLKTAPATLVANGSTHRAEPAPITCTNCFHVIPFTATRYLTLWAPGAAFCSRRCRLAGEAKHVRRVDAR